MDNKIVDEFQFATAAVKIIIVVIGLAVLVISRYAFVFFVAATLPSLIAILFDRNKHRCLSATVCAFNLMAILPYLKRLWESDSIDLMSQNIIGSVSTWVVIYGTSTIGQLIYLALPILLVSIYSVKASATAEKYRKEQEKIKSKWNI